MRCRGRRQLVGLVPLLLCFGVAASGCSFVFVDGPPPRQERRTDFDCSTGYGVPALDTGVVVLGLSFLLIRGAGAYAVGGLDRSEGALVAFSTMLGFFFSAVTGYERVYACREALQEAEPPPEAPHHHRPPPSRPAPAGVATPSVPTVPQEPDSSDAP
jgi:hypothetical protein